MSHDEFISWLMKIGCGWLGWRPDEVMDADMSDVVLAYEGKLAFLELMRPKAGPAGISSVEEFDALFG
jgi:hypothetical protein